MRNTGDADGLIVVDMRGDAMFANIDRFKRVIETMLRRAVSNLVDSDSAISHYLNTLHGEYDLSSMFIDFKTKRGKTST